MIAVEADSGLFENSARKGTLVYPIVLIGINIPKLDPTTLSLMNAASLNNLEAKKMDPGTCRGPCEQ